MQHQQQTPSRFVHVFGARAGRHHALRTEASTVYNLRATHRLCALSSSKAAQTIESEDLEYKDSHLMRDKHEGCTEGARLHEWHQMQSSDVAEKLYRLKTPTAEDKLRCNPKRPCRSCRLTLNSAAWITRISLNRNIPIIKISLYSEYPKNKDIPIIRIPS